MPAALLLAAACAPYHRTDMPSPRGGGLRDAIASLVPGCDAPRDEGQPPRRCATAEDRGDGAPTRDPKPPTQRTP